MTHPSFATQLDAYLDGELPESEARALEVHVAQCPECTRFRDQRLALRTAIRTQVPDLRAPAVLVQRVRRQARWRWRVRGPVLWRALGVAVSLVVIVLGSWRLGFQHGIGASLTESVLASHIRSLMPGHLADVASSDRHTVKPWFDGRIDYSPPVNDFADRGFPLLGGRLDYVGGAGGRPVSALVYGRRQHVINVLVWPTSAAGGSPASSAPAVQTKQGYHVLHWASANYTYWIVSDLSLPELQEFEGFLRQADR